MKKRLSVFIALLVACLFVTACSVQSDERNDRSTTKAEYIAKGGDGDYDYDSAYAPKLYSLSSDLMDYISENSNVNLDNWLQQETEKIKSSSYGTATPTQTPLLLLAIETFDISKTTFSEINDKYVQIYESHGDYSFIEQTCFSEEEIDALYSGNSALITEVFATEYAIVEDGQAFAPKFYLNATASELSSYGITDKMVTAKTNVLLADSIIERNEVK